MGSATLEVINYLSPLLDPVPVTTTLVGWNEGDQWVRLTKTGGAGGSSNPISGVGAIIIPRFNVDVYGADYDSTEVLAEQVKDALTAINWGGITWTDVAYTDADHFGEPAWLPDPISTTAARFNWIVQLTGKRLT